MKIVLVLWLLAALAANGLAQSKPSSANPPVTNAPAAKSLLADDEGLPIDPQVIEIIPQIRSARASAIPRYSQAQPVCPVAFMLAGKWHLTDVQVVAAKDLATNKTPM